MNGNTLQFSQFDWLKKLPRLFVGLILLSTGIGKLLDIPGFVLVLDAYQLTPLWMTTLLAYSLPFIEFFTGLNLLVSERSIHGVLVAVILHVLMLTAVTVTYLREIPVENCGCFGVFLARPLSFQTIVEDVFMLVISIIALIQERQKTSNDISKISPSSLTKR